MFYLLFFLVNLCGKLLILPIIQNSSYRKFSPVGFAASPRPPPFKGVNFKRWCAQTILWLTTMRCFDATKVKLDEELTPLEEKGFKEANTLLRGAIIGALGENIIDSYLSICHGAIL
jgi:hypothetical protein